jgi:hypothetical protein
MDRSSGASGVGGSASFGRLVADPAHGPLPALMLVLTVLTGVVDAVSILSLGRVFVANMTGNVVFVGFALAGASGFSLSASLSALAGFQALPPISASGTVSPSCAACLRSPPCSRARWPAPCSSSR